MIQWLTTQIRSEWTIKNGRTKGAYRPFQCGYEAGRVLWLIHTGRGRSYTSQLRVGLMFSIIFVSSTGKAAFRTLEVSTNRPGYC
jgi:hypothetical protein